MAVIRVNSEAQWKQDCKQTAEILWALFWNCKVLELVSNLLVSYEVIQKKTGNGEILSSHKPSGDFLNPLAKIMPHPQLRQ